MPEAIKDVAVSVQSMSYQWPDGSPALSGISLELPKGCRSVVVGANGAGKSCLLRTIGGMYPYEGMIKVLGMDAHVPTRIGTGGSTEIMAGVRVWRFGDCTIVGERWNPQGDMKVSSLLPYVEGLVPERCDMMVDRFGIDLDWKVNQLSDGRKRRVQLLIALAKPSKVLLLDEVTTDLDVLARQTLLELLREESEERGVTVLFSTHIFDGLEDWGTHLTHIRHGSLHFNGPLSSILGLEELKETGENTPLYAYVGATVRQDAEEAKKAGWKSTRCAGSIPMLVSN
mmetsp:Transcript_27907/g.56534  ORF Transcript_27907/g.56534 Transcript_27907/m.56534 type:complete len:285 (-) Transcript_27907:136-990(-)